MTKGRELSSARTRVLTRQGSGVGAGDLDEGRRSHKVSRLQFARWFDLSLFLLAPLGLFLLTLSLSLSLPPLIYLSRVHERLGPRA